MELLIISAILALTVVIHVFLWRDSKKRYDECIKQAEAINELLRKLEHNDAEIDGMLDETEDEIRRLGDEIDAFRSALFVGRKRATLDN